MLFVAELIEVKAKKLASGDKSFRLILETDNPIVVELQKYIAESVINVEIESG